MMHVNMHEAKTTLSRLVQKLEDREESVIFIARNGRTVAKLEAVKHEKQYARIGIAAGAVVMPPEDSEVEAELARGAAALFNEPSP